MNALKRTGRGLGPPISRDPISVRGVNWAPDNGIKDEKFMKTTFALALIAGASLAGAAQAQLVGGAAGQVTGSVGATANTTAQLPNPATTVDQATTRVEAAKDKAEDHAEHAKAKAKMKVEDTRLPSASADAGASGDASAETPAASAELGAKADASTEADPN